MDTVPESRPAAVLPVVTRLLLERLQLEWRAARPDEQPDATRQLQAALVEDEIGPLLVLFLGDRLLDLAQLKALTGRTLQPVSRLEQRQRLARQGLSSLPALPQLLGLPCLYARVLQKLPELWLNGGAAGSWVILSGPAFCRLMEAATSGEIGIPLAPLQAALAVSVTAADRLQAGSFTARRVQQRLGGPIELPPRPRSASRIIQLRTDPATTVEDITRLVETDPALAAQVVSWASSPYYASPSRIRSVEDAIVRVLGFDVVINLALGLALGKAMSLPADEAYYSQRYWQQAVYSAALMDGLVRLLPDRSADIGMAYLCGLLHNIGWLVLAHVFPPYFRTLCQHLALNPHLSHRLVEQHLLGITREQVGAWLMQHWEMPEELLVTLRFQADPEYQGPHARYPALVSLANLLLHEAGEGERPVCQAGSLFGRLGIDRTRAGEVLQQVLQARSALRELARQLTPPA